MDEDASETDALPILEQAKNFARTHLSRGLGADGREFIVGWWKTVAYHDVELARGLLDSDRWVRKNDFAPWFRDLLEKDPLARKVASQLVAEKLASGTQLSPEESKFTQKFLREEYINKQGRHWSDNRMRDIVLAGSVKMILKNYAITKEDAFSIVANEAYEVTRPPYQGTGIALSADSVKKIYLAQRGRKSLISFT